MFWPQKFYQSQILCFTFDPKSRFLDPLLPPPHPPKKKIPTKKTSWIIIFFWALVLHIMGQFRVKKFQLPIFWWSRGLNSIKMYFWLSRLFYSRDIKTIYFPDKSLESYLFLYSYRQFAENGFWRIVRVIIIYSQKLQCLCIALLKTNNCVLVWLKWGSVLGYCALRINSQPQISKK